jgi:hypothetical protein
MSTDRLIPAYFDGEARKGEPVFLKTSAEIKALRKSGTVEGWYQENGTVFVIYRGRKERSLAQIERAIAASTMQTAWVTKQSGYAGPLVMQMRTERIREAESY